MRWLASVALLVLCGCDRVLGLGGAQLADASDGPAPDAARTCAAGLPAFHSELHQVAPGTAVYDYTIAPDAMRAIAIKDNGKSVLEGPVDGTLDPANGLPIVETIRFDPDGNGGLVVDLSTTQTERYARAPDGAWSLVAAATGLSNPAYTYEYSSPSRGPMHHLLVQRTDGGIDELVSSDEIAWTFFPTYTTTMLGAGTAAGKPSLTADALHAVFLDPVPNVRYLERSSADVPFSGPAATLDSLSAYASAVGTYLLTGYLTEDCNRFYFPVVELASVFYVQQ